MLLRHINIPDLAAIFRRHEGLSPVPYLFDEACKARARQYAKTSGIWADLDNRLHPDQPISVIKRSIYRGYQRTGERAIAQARVNERMQELKRACLALWLEHPLADTDYLQDLLWAYCDDWTWVTPAHEGHTIDLGAAKLAATMAETLHVVGESLEEEVTQRVTQEIQRRIFEPFFSCQFANTWKSVRHNWNHVCNGEIIRTALYQIEDPRLLANMVHGAIQNLTYGLDGFTEDGGCVEGPGYWDYGFGHYLYVAQALFFRTGGEINLLADEKIRRICEYPLATHIDGPLRATFADSSHGYLPARLALIVDSFEGMPNLYPLCERLEDGRLRLKDMHELALYDSEKQVGELEDRDWLLPELGMVKLLGAKGPTPLTLLALAGHNGVNHNHNDIGSFMLYKHGQLFFVDPGGPVYSRVTFSKDRYRSVFCNSFGHSVPTINGCLQELGSEYYGTLQVENLGGQGRKRAVIDMTHAYPSGLVKRLIRSFEIETHTGRLWLEDVYTFDSAPHSIEEALITFHPVCLSADGASVRIGDEACGMTVTAEGMAGRFAVMALVEESKEGRTGQTIHRITFHPEEVQREMTIRFFFT
ncbi:MAG: heparinase II/III family protein [Firmicutes bacterium]|nr:heparinase II/III family protein [Bacillota bacterium]